MTKVALISIMKFEAKKVIIKLKGSLNRYEAVSN